MRWQRFNHYYSSGALLARIAVNLATLMWAAMVLWRDDALEGLRYPFYNLLTGIMHEDLWALGALAASGLGIYRLVTCSVPSVFGAIGYAMQMLFWCYVCATLLLEYSFPLPPATTAALIVVALLSVYAFTSNAKSHEPE